MVNGKDHNNQKILNLALGIGILTTLIALALYGYLGTFSRYGGDDYCLSAFFYQDGSLADLMIDRYMNSSSRYTNILFIGLADKLFGWYNVAVLPPLMLVLFVLGTYLFLSEILRFASLRWNRLLVLFLAALVVYFSVLQAPDLYETLYWRAGMTSHFAPLVFLTFLGAYLVREIRLAGERAPSTWTYVLCFLLALVLGGFSEPPVAVVITILSFAILAVWLGDKSPARRARFMLLFWTLAGSLIALLLLGLAPANAIRLETAPPGLTDLILRTFKFPLEFILDVFRSSPVSNLMTFLIPAVLFYGLYTRPDRTDSTPDARWIAFLIIAISLFSYLLIAASFAPSVYGQSFPVARARFAGRVILTCALMANGALIGILLAGMKTKQPVSTFLYRLAIFSLMLLTFYPLRTASRVIADVPAYQQRASAWDARDARIRDLQASGERNLRVPFLGEEIIQDLGDRTGFRLNRCASSLYGVDSILALPVDGE